MQQARSRFSGKIIFVIFAFLFISSRSFCEVIETSDPIKDGGGARPLGLGRAVTASINDANAMFYNPAGLVAIKSPQIMGMYYTKVFGTYTYLTAAFASPTPWGGVAGLGYVSSGISDIALFTDAGTSESFTSYNDNVLILSYADSLKRIDPDLDNIYVGANVKLFTKGASSPIDFHATGYNLDLGVKYMPYDWLTFGLNKQNIFQSDLVWNTGHSEKYPSPLFIGTRMKDMTFGEAFTFDVEVPSDPASPNLYHIGTEYPATKNLTLRLGGDQAVDVSNNKVLWNFALGLGLMFGGFSIDYAYHTYYNDPNYGSHFVSLTYVGDYENNIKAYAGTATGQKPVQGDTVIIQVATPYAESYVAAITPDGTKIPLKLDKRIDRWTGTWVVPADYKTGNINFEIYLVDIEGNEDPIYTNDIIIITPEQATVEAAQEAKKVEDAQKEEARNKVWEQIQKDLGSTRSKDQFVNGDDMMTVIAAEKKMTMARVEKREGVLLISDVVNMLYESEIDISKRELLKDHLSKVGANRQATYNDLVDAVLDSGYFNVAVPPQPVEVAQAPMVKNGVTEQGIVVVEAPMAQVPAKPEEIKVAEKPAAQPPAEAGTGGLISVQAPPVTAPVPQVVAEAPQVKPVTKIAAVPEGKKPVPTISEQYAEIVDKTFNVIEKYIGIKDLRGKPAFRKDIAVMIAKRNGYSLRDSELASFRDVDPSMPESRYIQACYDNNVLIGYPGKMFAPNRVISSYELLWMMSDSEKSSAGKAAIKGYAKHEGNFKVNNYEYVVNTLIKTGYLTGK